MQKSDAFGEFQEEKGGLGGEEGEEGKEGGDRVGEGGRISLGIAW